MNYSNKNNFVQQTNETSGITIIINIQKKFKKFYNYS